MFKYVKPVLFTSFLFCCLFSKAVAQTPDSLQEQLLRKWKNAKAYTLKIAAAMPDQYYDFRPVPAEMSFKEQLLHIADNIEWLSATYLLAPGRNVKRDTSILNKAAILKILNDVYDMGSKAQSDLPTARLDEKVTFFAGPLTRRQILFLMHDHQAHHAGQLIVYLRLKGIIPPEYIGW